MKTFKTMLKTELKLSLRGMDMLIFAICMPLVVLVIIGMIYGDRAAYEGAQNIPLLSSHLERSPPLPFVPEELWGFHLWLPITAARKF